MIKNIIFDLGGVLYKINYETTFAQLGKLIGHDLTVGKWPDWFKSLVIQYETGEIPTERFLLNIQMKSRINPIPHGNNLVRAWNAMLVGWEDQVFDMLVRLASQYKLYILSNINPLHEQQLEFSLLENGGLNGLLRWFDGIYFSHKIGFRKPDVRCFEVIVKENDLLPEETLFIDDYPKNILEAKEIGLQCVVHNPKLNINNEIKKYLDLAC